MKFNNIQTYKHDITGKFNFISQVVANIPDADFSNGTENETLMAIHNSILRMVNTSRETLLSVQKNVTSLKIVRIVDENSTLINVSDIELAYCYDKMQTSYSMVYNPEDLSIIHKISTLIDLLPINQILLEEVVKPQTAIEVNELKRHRGIL
jgi:hypothetical protein